MGNHVSCIKHHGPAHEVLPGRLYAGAGMARTQVPEGALTIDLAEQFVPVVRSIGIQIPGLTTKYLGIKWPDGGVPNLAKDQWAAIARATRRGKVFVGCMGGHGRTGTALVMLLHFWKAFPTKDTDPIAWVREHYCPEAVETQGQVAYIVALTGRATACKGSISARPTVKASTPDSFAKTAGLCPERIGAKFCNLDHGHAGPCDVRPRAQLLAEGLCGGKAWSAAPKPERIVYCAKSVKCLLRDKHEGKCNDSLNDYVKKG